MSISDIHLLVLDELIQIRLMELRLYGGPASTALTRACGVKGCACTTIVDIIASHADALMYAPRSPEGRASRTALVEGIAVGAWSNPLGVDLWGHHWCRTTRCREKHPTLDPASEEVQT